MGYIQEGEFNLTEPIYFEISVGFYVPELLLNYGVVKIQRKAGGIRN